MNNIDFNNSNNTVSTSGCTWEKNSMNDSIHTDRFFYTDNSIGANYIADSSIGANYIADSSIGANYIADSSIGANYIADRSIAGSISFNVPSANEIIRLEKDGKIYIRGELVDDNIEVYEAMITFLNQTGDLNLKCKLKQNDITESDILDELYDECINKKNSNKQKISDLLNQYKQKTGNEKPGFML